MYLKSHRFPLKVVSKALVAICNSEIVKGGGRAPPPPPPAWADFSIMMECTPESGNCHSVCTLWCRLKADQRLGAEDREEMRLEAISLSLAPKSCVVCVSIF
jgi:hypothetical protein